VFPCANGNLEDVWKIHNNPIPDQADENHRRRASLWFAQQCLGFAQGLQIIHSCENDSPGIPIGEKTVAWYGDLRPEKILWFRDFDHQAQGYSLGVLKISMSLGTRNRSSPVFSSGPYGPLEHDINMSPSISTASSIWTLACILLEFVTWFLEGGQGVEKFENARVEENDRKLPAFFSDVEACDERGILKTFARIKKSVVHVSKDSSNIQYFHHLIVRLGRLATRLAI